MQQDLTRKEREAYLIETAKALNERGLEVGKQKTKLLKEVGDG